MADSAVSHWIALSLIPGLGGATARRLMQRFGEPEHIFAASPAELREVVPEALAGRISAGPGRAAVDAALAWLAEEPNHAVTLADPAYPRQLLETPDPPPLLFVKGRLDLLNRPALAVVGSRNATPQGMKNAEAFSRSLSDCGLTIVSGLALGIDAAAHRGALAGASSTLAVAGTGLDIVYPARNRELAREIAQHGALVSEFPLGTPSKIQNFPRRNRIISGLAQGCLVVEAALQSGSLITARFAAEQGREVFAIPGSIHSPLSKGCHALIKQGAKLVESAQDILEELPGAPLTALPAPARSPESGHSLLQHMGHDPVDIDTLAARSGLTSDSVCAMLLQMELEGAVASLAGGRYQRLS